VTNTGVILLDNMKYLSERERTALARKAAKARWSRRDAQKLTLGAATQDRAPGDAGDGDQDPQTCFAMSQECGLG
jgi:hypothetical protein